MLLIVVAIWGAWFSGPTAPPPPSNCQFTSVSGRWEGTCGRLFGQSPTLTVAAVKASPTGVWRKNLQPTAVWTGEMAAPGLPAQPIEIEVYPGGSGVFRTLAGWFPVSAFERSTDTLRFQLDVSQPVPPSDLDREIVQRAAAILSSESVWDRADDRECAAEDKTWSIYCAMERATVEVTGAFHHRRPALELVRQIVEQRTAERKYQHRLMDYNNDPSTKLDDVHSLFAEALARMSR